MESRTLTEIYRDLMRLNHLCREGREFDIAYHALMAALRSAQELKNISFLQEIERTAHEQLKYIDAYHPEYEHSTVTAATRHHAGIFQTLAQQANARIVIIQNTPRHAP
jgi:hypothetical protein